MILRYTEVSDYASCKETTRICILIVKLLANLPNAVCMKVGILTRQRFRSERIDLVESTD
jgi:hypothetical protein